MTAFQIIIAIIMQQVVYTKQSFQHGTAGVANNGKVVMNLSPKDGYAVCIQAGSFDLFAHGIKRANKRGFNYCSYIAPSGNGQVSLTANHKTDIETNHMFTIKTKYHSITIWKITYFAEPEKQGA